MADPGLISLSVSISNRDTTEFRQTNREHVWLGLQPSIARFLLTADLDAPPSINDLEVMA